MIIRLRRVFKPRIWLGRLLFRVGLWVIGGTAEVHI